MDYALAKALKDASFPQEGRGTRVPPPDKIVARRDDYAYVPMLEDLIEACGSRFVQLELNSNKKWLATSAHPDAYKFFAGDTATEAVARLWLALNT